MMVVALAACSRAEAVPPPAIQPPAGWQPLAELATAASEAAKGDGVPVEAAAAWGDTAMGCYALALTVRGDSSPAAISKELAAGFVATKIGDVAAGSDSVALTFERGAYRGKLHAQIRDSAIEAVACFWNEREPDACAAACAGMMK
jgi:hypothetical protein